MRVFNEEEKVGIAEIILLLKRKEAQILMEIIEYDYKQRPKKITWKVLYDKLELMGIY